jgi:DNA repair protein RadC
MHDTNPHPVHEVNVLRDASPMLPLCITMAQTHGEQTHLGAVLTDSEQLTLCEAMAILAKLVRTQPIFEGPENVQKYLQIKLCALNVEVFGVLLLDAQNRLIEDVILFRGTLTQTSVYPREVVKLAVVSGAASCVVYHNHPSGRLDFSRADEHLTQTLKSSLQLVDVRVLDHLLIAESGSVSMAERGIL